MIPRMRLDEEKVPDVSAWQALTTQLAASLDKKQSINTYWQENTRVDGRLLSQCRPTTIQRGILTKYAQGSSLVHLGKGSSASQALAAVTLYVGQPVSAPEAGELQVSITSLSHTFDLGQANVLQAWVQRILCEAVDVDALVIERHQACWGLHVTIHTMQNQGNLKDLCLLASIAALLDVALPKVTIGPDGKVWLTEQKDSVSPQRLKMRAVPISLTMVWYKGTADDDNNLGCWIVDLNTAEESACTSSALTIVVDVQSLKIMSMDLLSLTCPDSGSNKTLLALAIHMATGRAQELGKCCLIDKRK